MQATPRGASFRSSIRASRRSTWALPWILLFSALAAFAADPLARAQGPRLVPAAPAASAPAPYSIRPLVPVPPRELAVPDPSSTVEPLAGLAPRALSAELDELLHQGRQFELESRWSDALRHYESSLRRFPHEPSLERRFRNARLHHDVSRRYADTSFVQLVHAKSLDAALALYDEVVLKIQAHYVDSPSLKQLVEAGSSALEVALDEPNFRSKNNLTASQDRADLFRAHLRTTLGPLVVQTPRDARSAVYQAAALAQHQLGIPPTATVFEYACGAVSTLDPYSAYLTPTQLRDVYSQIDGNFVGLGIELEAKNRLLKIVRVIPGSPAERGGIKAGDIILGVDGHSTASMNTDQAAELLQGPINSICRLRLQAEGQPPRDVAVRREHVEVPSIDRVDLDRNGIGYLRLSCFQKTTARDLDSALWGLQRQGMRGLVIDMRGNPGGLLVTAVDVVDKFLEAGVIVSTNGRSPGETFTYSAHEFGTWRVPLVILIDGESASAAEIFAGAIRDHRRGTIIGERSFGKGSVQGIFPLAADGAGVRLTTAKFYSPSGRAYSDFGVEPDIAVHRVARPTADGQSVLGASDDAMLMAAVEEALRLVRSR